METGDCSVPALVAALEDSDDKIRSSAAYGLADFAPDSQDVLIQIVGSLDREFSSETDMLRLLPLTNYLVCAGKSVESVIESLLKYLRTFNQWKPGTVTVPWENTMAAIGNIGPSAKIAIPLLIEALVAATDEKVINASLDALVKIGPASARPLMEFVTFDTRAGWFAKHEAVMTLGRIDDAAAETTPFLSTIATHNTTLRKIAIEALAALGASSTPVIPQPANGDPNADTAKK